MSLSQEPLVGHKKAFTLIELLVVVAIITILVAVLIPSLSNSRQQARNTVCQNNLRQIYTVIKMYAEESLGKFPDEKVAGKSTYRRAPGLISQEDGGTPETLGLQAALERYQDGSTDTTVVPIGTKMAKSFMCPSAVPLLQVFKSNYSYNVNTAMKFKYADQFAFTENITTGKGITEYQLISDAWSSYPHAPSGASWDTNNTLTLIPLAQRVRPHVKVGKVPFYYYVTVTGSIGQN